MSNTQNRSPVTALSLLRYGLIALPLSFAGLPLYMHAPAYYAQHYGVPLTALALSLLLLRIFDSFQDPVIGWLGDRYATKRPAIIAGAIIMLAAGILMLFYPYSNSPLIWFCVSMIFTTTAFSILAIHVNTLGGLWTKNHHDKTKITTAREAMALCGILLASLLPPLLEYSFPSGNALSIFSVFTAILTILCGYVFWIWLKRQDFATAPPKRQAGIKNLAKIVMTGSIRGFFAAYFLAALASAFPLVMFLFFVNDYLEAREWTGIFLVIYFLSGIAAMPFWLFLSRRSGKVFSWGLSMLLAVAAFSWVGILQTGDTFCFAAICLVSGLALGASMALPPSILADLIEADGSQDHATGQFSAQAFLSKLALAIASAVGLFGLANAGYDVSRTHQSRDAADALIIYYGFVPCGIQLTALIVLFLWNYKHGKKIYEKKSSNKINRGYHHGDNHVS